MKFKASIKSEPRDIVTGQFNGCADATGLHLVNRKHRTIDIPLNSQIHYIRNNHCAVDLDECRVEIRVSKFGIYQNRLTRDLVSFIQSNDEKLPQIENYRIPFYLMLMVFAPLLLPFLVNDFSVPSLVAGLMLFINYSFAQSEQKPVFTRITSQAFVLVMGYGAYFTWLSLGY